MGQAIYQVFLQTPGGPLHGQRADGHAFAGRLTNSFPKSCTRPSIDHKAPSRHGISLVESLLLQRRRACRIESLNHAFRTGVFEAAHEFEGVAPVKLAGLRLHPDKEGRHPAERPEIAIIKDDKRLDVRPVSEPRTNLEQPGAGPVMPMGATP